jgi:hypothetical protein
MRRHTDIPDDKKNPGIRGPRLSLMFGTVNAIALILILGIISVAALVLVVRLSRSR